MIKIVEHQMEENPDRVSSKYGAQMVAEDGAARKNRYTIDESADLVECSGKYCKSCTAGLVADCVALCCCPCALVNLFTLAFVKVPLMVGRRCLGREKKKKKKNKVQEIEGDDIEIERDGILKWEILEIVGDEEEKIASVSARFEAEKVWLELYQVGHLGFGRISLSDI